MSSDSVYPGVTVSCRPEAAISTVAASTARISAASTCRRSASDRWRPTERGTERYHSSGCGRGLLMAGALRPVVFLMLVASVLFVVDGVLDGVYPGGPAWFTGKYQNLAEVAYIFAILNTLVAYLVARGSERSLVARIGLSAFFLVERPLTAFILGPKELAAVVVHLTTALVELVILVAAVRVSDGVVSGFVPGGREWGLSGDASGWLVYLFAIVVLTVAARAVHGGRLALRLLLATALLFVIERAFSPFALKVVDPMALALHELAAFVALALALSCASAIRARRASPQADVASLEAA